VSLTAEADDLASAEAALRERLGQRNVLVKSCAMLFDQKRLELEVEEPRPGALASALNERPPALRTVKWTALAPRPVKEEA
jgi:hypothetical protein